MEPSLCPFLQALVGLVACAAERAGMLHEILRRARRWRSQSLAAERALTAADRSCRLAAAKRTTLAEALKKASIEVRRLTLRAEEADFEGRRRALDAALRDALRRLESLTAERGRVVLGKLSEVDGRLRATFRALCDDGDASLEYATTPAVLFEEGVSIRARPPQSEWSHFEELSGGQKALVAVALQLALHPPDASHPCLYDEVDAALDTRRTKALADFMAQREGAQSIFVSHRPELLEAATMLVGCYVGESGGSQAVHAAFRATNSAATAKWRWTCSHVADAAPEWPALLAATTTATLILRADPSYPTVALFHVSLTLRKILKRRAAESPTSRTLWIL
ncbi:hypothetical protein EMIHUDRAFT_448505 [Emiliania huxleyi CCMP1516]|uniref:RecF/RecN/SMC N-terminal domain-containing protein n=2 Tax=Emiliania huxleyi TaxID=2903 RepID=A0A0D3I7C5_EMIH1|nr:hypothetical protein EMIHUDRAFT_448505 [Emiliania huxleyi CCMP1516]EOD07160.1 hypothetical protein EMIHUDRAFT_448505 [Emiliania huxleyi CCMP1516]|eukprot:XP_005759589.1 hypothetical protein EMIHUDRAFT_448505 [Emiliania huxleyi CCMP1516]